MSFSWGLGAIAVDTESLVLDFLVVLAHIFAVLVPMLGAERATSLGDGFGATTMGAEPLLLFCGVPSSLVCAFALFALGAVARPVVRSDRVLLAVPTDPTQNWVVPVVSCLSELCYLHSDSPPFLGCMA